MDYGSGGQADTATAISAAEEKTRPECRSSAYVVSPTGNISCVGCIDMRERL